MVQALFPDGDGIFQDDNAPIHSARVVKNCMKSIKVSSNTWSGHRILQVAIFIEYLWCVLERQVRNRYPPPSCLKELGQILMEEWVTIPVDEVRKLYA